MKIKLKKAYDAIIYTGENDNDIREFLGYPRCVPDQKFKLASTVSFVPQIGSAIFYNENNNISWLPAEDYEVVNE